LLHRPKTANKAVAIAAAAARRIKATLLLLLLLLDMTGPLLLLLLLLLCCCCCCCCYAAAAATHILTRSPSLTASVLSARGLKWPTMLQERTVFTQSTGQLYIQLHFSSAVHKVSVQDQI
jgi:hypothetical protein